MKSDVKQLFPLENKDDNLIDSYDNLKVSIVDNYKKKDYESVLSDFTNIFKIKRYNASKFIYAIKSLENINSSERFKKFCDQCCTEEMKLGEEIFSKLISSNFETKDASSLFDQLIKLHFSDKAITDTYNEAFNTCISAIKNRKYLDIKSDTNNKYIMLSGTGWSGSGAVIDYLKEFDNVEAVKNEWAIIESSSLGFQGLVSNINNLSKLRESATLLLFSLLGSCKFRSTLWAYSNITLAYKKCHLKNYSLLYAQKYSEICHVIANIVVASFELNQSYIKDNLHVIANRLVELMGINVAPNKIVLIDNCIHLSNLHLLEYCTNVKMIGVVRDPRSNYVAKINESPAFSLSAESFAKTIKQKLSRMYRKLENLSKETSEHIRIIHFEDFVLKENARKEILKFLELSEDNWISPRAFFNPDESKKNVYLHKMFSNQKDIATIYELAHDYCYELM